MTADSILRPADNDEHAVFSWQFWRGDDAEQLFARTGEDDGLFVDTHRRASSAASVATISSGASSISVVCQKAGPRTTWASTVKLAACHCSMRFCATGVSWSSSRNEVSSHTPGRRCWIGGFSSACSSASGHPGATL